MDQIESTQAIHNMNMAMFKHQGKLPENVITVCRRRNIK